LGIHPFVQNGEQAATGFLDAENDIIPQGVDDMSVIAEAEELALSLSKADRGRLVSKHIASLGHPFEDDEDIIELSLRRAKEMDEHPETVMSEDEFWTSLEEYRRR
jgi:hypothetical protein